jgi:predicted RNA-binding Zn-ribbon protein involved in translation (DUF1610 family)
MEPAASPEQPVRRTRKKIPPSGLLCPECGSVETRQSRKKGFVVMVLRAFKFTRFKCTTCGNRFYAASA